MQGLLYRRQSFILLRSLFATGYGYNIHFPTTVRGPANCKYHKTTSWLKKCKSGKSSESSCTITKSTKGKIIFRVKHPCFPKIILEEPSKKPNITTFRNSINKVFECKHSRSHRSKQDVNRRHSACSKQPLESFSWPKLKETPTSTSHRITIDGSLCDSAMKESHSAAHMKCDDYTKDASRSIGNDKTNQVDMHKRSTDPKSTKDVASISSAKNTPKTRKKPLVFSSSEMLMSSTGTANKAGVNTLWKPKNGFGLRKQPKVEKCSITPLENAVDSTTKLFMSRNYKSRPAMKKCRLSDTMENIMQPANDEETALDRRLHLECTGQKSALQETNLDRRSGDHVTPATLSNCPSGEAVEDTGKWTGLNQCLSGVMKQGDDYKSTPLNVHSLKKSETVTLHTYVDLKRQIREERIEYDTTVIEQEGKKIMKILPKSDSALRRKSSNQSLAVIKTKNRVVDVDRNSMKEKMVNNYCRNTKIDTTTQKNPVTQDLDRIVIPEDGKKISSVVEDQSVPKINVQTSSGDVDGVVIPADGRIRQGDCPLKIHERDLGLLSKKVVIPQDGNTIAPCEAEAGSTVSRNESMPVKDNSIRRHLSNDLKINKEETSSKNKKSLRHLLPPYNHKTSNEPKKILDGKESFADSFVTVSEQTGISNVRGGTSEWKRKVVKMKFVPLKESEFSRNGSLIPSHRSNQGMQQTTRPKINVSSETKVALKSRLPLPPPASINLNSRSTQAELNGLRQTHISKSTTGNSSKSEVTISSNVGLITTDSPKKQVNAKICPQTGFVHSNPPLSPTANNTAGHSSLPNKSGYLMNCTNSSSSDMPKATFPPPCNAIPSGIPQVLDTTGHSSVPNKSGYLMNCTTSSSSDMPKATFPPPCNAIPPGRPQVLYTTGHSSLPNNSGYLMNCTTNSGSDMPKATFPPPCNACHSNSIPSGRTQGNFPTDNCSTQAVSESPKEIHQPEQIDYLSRPTCRPEFPPPCSTNPCTPTTCRTENRCYDPYNVVTKSTTHTILDIDNLPRPPPPIRFNCLPKSKPCFPPQCPEQCQTKPRTWCPQMLNTKSGISFPGWRAYMNYTYWSIRCLFTGILESFLTLLKAQIMHSRERYRKNNGRKSKCCIQDRNVVQSSLITHKRAAHLGMSSAKRKHKQEHSPLQQIKHNKNKTQKKVKIVKSMKTPVHDTRSKQAVAAEEDKRKSVGSKVNPALAYSEVLNIVFSQKKSV